MGKDLKTLERMCVAERRAGKRVWSVKRLRRWQRRLWKAGQR